MIRVRMTENNILGWRQEARTVCVWIGCTVFIRHFKRIKSANYFNNRVGKAYQEGVPFIASFDKVELTEEGDWRHLWFPAERGHYNTDHVRIEAAGDYQFACTGAS